MEKKKMVMILRDDVTYVCPHCSSSNLRAVMHCWVNASNLDEKPEVDWDSDVGCSDRWRCESCEADCFIPDEIPKHDSQKSQEPEESTTYVKRYAVAFRLLDTDDDTLQLRKEYAIDPWHALHNAVARSMNWPSAVAYYYLCERLYDYNVQRVLLSEGDNRDIVFDDVSHHVRAPDRGTHIRSEETQEAVSAIRALASGALCRSPDFKEAVALIGALDAFKKSAMERHQTNERHYTLLEQGRKLYDEWLKGEHDW